MTEQALCEQIEREQGFIIVAHSREMPVGFVASNCRAALGRPYIPPMEVKGYCTREEWLAQRRRYHSTEEPPIPERPYFYHKCVIAAEARQ